MLGYVSDPLVRLIHLFKATREIRPGFRRWTSSLTTWGVVLLILKFDSEVFTKPMCDVYETNI